MKTTKPLGIEEYLPKRVLRLGDFGMFANINLYLNATWRGAQEGFTVVPQWDRCLYKPDHITDGWDLFFERVNHTYGDKDYKDVIPISEDFVRNGPFSPRGPHTNASKDFTSTLLLPPERTPRLRRHIEKFLHLKPHIISKILPPLLDFSAYRPETTIHLRGPGRIHAGCLWMEAQRGWRNPPIPQVVELVRTFRLPRTTVLVLTDCSDTYNKISHALTGEYSVISSGSFMSSGGESHHEEDPSLDKYLLGLEVIRDSLLMAFSNCLIHGNSNITNFVQALNPRLETHDVFNSFYEQHNNNRG